MTPFNMPVLGFAANSGTGKTTLLSRIIPLLNDRGLKTGLVKHSHHDFDIDQPGKDSYRLRKAGASPVLLISKHRQALITELDGQEPVLKDQLQSFTDSSLDLIIVEGFKHEQFPKIELHRKALNNPLLFPSDPSIIAIASDNNEVVKQTSLSEKLTFLDLNNLEQIVNFIIQFSQRRPYD